MAANLTTALIGLGGAVVGGGMSSFVAWLTARHSRQLQRDLTVANELYRQDSVMRTERREAYIHFLTALHTFNEAVMTAWPAARDDELEEGSPSPGDQLRGAMHELYFRFQALVLVSTKEIRDVASGVIDEMKISGDVVTRGEVHMIQEMNVIAAMRKDLGY